ncbi:MAG TPA: hypothetical protein VGG92_11370 [Caulobacteraceae bacterium]|jgi:hypothetical protein
MIVDRNFRFTEMTPEAAAWCGGTAAEFIGEDARVRCPSPASFVEAVESALTNGMVSWLEYESLIVPGRWVEADIEPLTGGGACVRIRDITSRVLANNRSKSD